MSGKGSSPRPKSVSNEEYASRWDAIFGRDPRIIEDQKNEDEAFEEISRKMLTMPGTIGSAKLVFQSDSEVDKIERNNVETQEVKKISR